MDGPEVQFNFLASNRVRRSRGGPNAPQFVSPKGRHASGSYLAGHFQNRALPISNFLESKKATGASTRVAVSGTDNIVRQTEESVEMKSREGHIELPKTETVIQIVDAEEPEIRTNRQLGLYKI